MPIAGSGRRRGLPVDFAAVLDEILCRRSAATSAASRIGIHFFVPGRDNVGEFYRSTAVEHSLFHKARTRSMNEPTTCPNCGRQFPSDVDGACPSCLESLAEGLRAIGEAREMELRQLKEQIDGLSAGAESAFFSPSLERKQRKHQEAAVRRARRTTLLKRAAVALAIATGAVLGNASVGIAQGQSLAEIADRAGMTFLYGVIVVPTSILIVWAVVIVRLAASRFAEADHDDGLVRLLISPWPYVRFVVWGSPAFFAGWDVGAEDWSWLRFGFAAAGSIATGAVVLVAFHPETESESIADLSTAGRHSGDSIE
jgi:hypothetical protein